MVWHDSEPNANHTSGAGCAALLETSVELQALREWVCMHLGELRLLAADHEFLLALDDKPCTFTTVVDFHEIHEYLFPFISWLSPGSSAIHDWRNAAMDFISRACLFAPNYLTGRPHIIVPYADEMFYAMLNYAEKVALVSPQVVDLISTTLERRLGALRTNLQIASDRAAQLMDLLVDEFPNALFILLADYADPTDQFLRLGHDVFQYPGHGHPLTGSLDAESAECLERWAKELNNIRGGGKERQSRSDASALAAVRMANLRSASEMSCCAHLLYTSSEAVLKLAANHAQDLEWVSQVGIALPVVRNPRSLLVFLQMAADVGDCEATRARNAAATYERIGEELIEFQEILALADQVSLALAACPTAIDRDTPVGGECTDCPVSAVAPLATKAIARIRDVQRRLHDGRLLLRHEISVPQIVRDALMCADEADVAHAVARHFLDLTDDSRFGPTLESKLRELRHETVPELIGLSALLAAHVEPLGDDSLSQLSAFPFHVRFANQELDVRVQAVVRLLEGATQLKGGRVKAVEALRSLVAGSWDSPSQPSERRLVELLVLLALGKPQMAFRLAETLALTEPGEFLADYEFIAARASIVLSNYDRARAVCEQAINRHETDARFRLLMGFLKWQEFCSANEENLVVLEEALANTDSGIKLAQNDPADSPLLHDLLNNRAYILAAIGGTRAIEALETLEQLKVLREFSSWKSSWLDTYGYALIRNAQRTGLSETKRKAMIYEAVAVLEEALACASWVGYRDPAEAHLQEARRLSGALG